jgi:hypothetical protein
MAQGTFKFFNAWGNTLLRGLLGDLTGATYHLAMVSTIPAVTAPDPRWGNAGGTDLSTTEVSGTGYAPGGNECPTPALASTLAVTSFDLDDPTKWTKNAAGPDNIKAAILYCSSDAGLRAIGFFDYTEDGTTAISLRVADIVPKLPNGIFDLTVNAA